VDPLVGGSRDDEPLGGDEGDELPGEDGGDEIPGGDVSDGLLDGDEGNELPGGDVLPGEDGGDEIPGEDGGGSTAGEGAADGNIPNKTKPKPPCMQRPKKHVAPCTAFASDIAGVIANFLQYIENYSTVYARYNEALLTLQAIYQIADIEAIVRDARSVPILEEEVARLTGDTKERTPDYEILEEVNISNDDVMTIPTRLREIADNLLLQWVIAVSNGMVYTTDGMNNILKCIRPVPLTDIRRNVCVRETHALTTLYRGLERMQVQAGVRSVCNPTRTELAVDRVVENLVSKYRLIADRIQNSVLATGKEALKARYYAAQQVVPSGMPEQLDLLAGGDPLSEIVVSPATILVLSMFNEQIARVATLGILVTEMANALQFRRKAHTKALIQAIKDSVDDRVQF
jgi:hypothetical protein